MKPILFLTLVLIFSCCTNFKTVPVLYAEYSLDDLSEIELHQYKVKAVLYQVLDSTINQANKCFFYEDIQIDYTFEVIQDSLGSFELNIASIYDLYTLDYNDCSGVFYYKGYQFLLYGPFVPEILEDMHKNKRLFYLNPDKLRHYYPPYGEFFNSSWTYSFRNGNFKFIDCFYCNKYYKASDLN